MMLCDAEKTSASHLINRIATAWLSSSSCHAPRDLPRGGIAEQGDVFPDFIALLLHDTFRYPHQVADLLQIQNDGNTYSGMGQRSVAYMEAIK